MDRDRWEATAAADRTGDTAAAAAAAAALAADFSAASSAAFSGDMRRIAGRMARAARLRARRLRQAPAAESSTSPLRHPSLPIKARTSPAAAEILAAPPAAAILAAAAVATAAARRRAGISKTA